MKRLFVLLLATLLIAGFFMPAEVDAVETESAELTYKAGTPYMRAMYSADAASIYANPNLDVWDMRLDLYGAGKFAKLGGVWDRDYLYIAYDKQSGDPVPEVKLNGVSAQNITVVSSDAESIARIPFAECNVLMDGFGCFCDLSIKIGNLSWNGVVIFDTQTYPAIIGTEFSSDINVEANGIRFTMEDGVDSSMQNNYLQYRNVEKLCSNESLTTVLEFDLLINNMPETFPDYIEEKHWAVCYGLHVGLTDESNSTVGELRNGLSFGITNVGGRVTLVSGNAPQTQKVFYTNIPISRKDNLHIRVEYDNHAAFSTYDKATKTKTRNNATARYYINGVLVGIHKDCKTASTTTTVDSSLYMSLRSDGDRKYEVIVNNITNDYEIKDVVDSKMLNDLNFDSFKGENLSINGVNSDLQLPVYVPGGRLNGLKLNWSSNNEDAITADGKVNPSANDTAVELKASIEGVDASKSFFLSLSNDSMVIPGAKKDVQLDGELNDAGWAFATELVGAGNPISMGGLWTDDALYIGCEKIDTSKMTLLVNGKTIENIESVTGDRYTEIRIPLADVGLTAAEGTQCPITILLNDVEFNGKIVFDAKDTSVTVQEIFLYVLIGVCVIFVGLVVLAIVLKLYKKIWFIIILVVVLLGGVFCGIAMNFDSEFDDGSSNLPAFSMPTSELASLMPVPDNSYGSVLVNTENNVVIELLKVTPSDFAAYVEKCRVSGFYDTSIDMDACYAAENDAEYTLSANYVLSEEKMLVSVACPSMLSKLTYENICLNNPHVALITSDVRLPDTAANGESGMDTYITWTSSDPTVIGLDGTVNRPDFGVSVVTLTATIKSTGEQKIFTLRVPGIDFNKGTLIATNDIAPATTSGIYTDDVQFTLDMTNNSIITDLGQTQKVNYVKITELDDMSRLSTTAFTLWGSTDNMQYTQIRDYKLLQVGKSWYLYDFEVDARYMKLHYGMFDIIDANVIGGCGEMIRAGYEEVFGGNGAEFKTSEYTLTNMTGKKQFDYAWTISKNELGITGSDNSVRIYLDNELLYHYIDGDDVKVRVPELEQGASVTLKVMSSDSAEPLNIANKEFVHEVIYGTTEIWTNLQTHNTFGRYNLGLPKGTKFPNGKVQEVDEILTMNASTCYSSTDGGSTWTAKSSAKTTAAGGTPLPADMVVNSHGWGIDAYTGRIFCTWHSYQPGKSWDQAEWRQTNFVYSDDGGYTWSYTLIPHVENKADPRYNVCSYTDVKALSCHDGDGPNIDLIFSAGGSREDLGVLQACVYYSRDAGKTWTGGASVIDLTAPEGFEMGASENNIVERDDGVLVMLFRYQNPDKIQFGISYSTDCGVSWSEAETSSVYAVNTQPVIHKFNINDEYVNLLNVPGHNAFGGVSYIRAPLVFASTTNGETYRNIQNIFAKTEGIFEYDRTTVTNTSFYKYNETDLFLSWNNAYTKDEDYKYMRVTDFDKWFTRTKGAYDSFEHGTTTYEDWDVYAGAVSPSKQYSTDGRWALHSERITQFTRYLPYLQDGKMSFDIYVTDKPLRMNLELQSGLSFNEGLGVAPIGIEVYDNVISFLGSDEETGLTLQQGWNTIVFDLELTNGKVTFQLNGSEAKAMPVDLEAGDYICYATFNGRREFFLDEFMVETYLDADVAATEEDHAAADAVINMIKNMGTDKAAVEAARKAYDALTVVQRDFVNCRYFNADGTHFNYYDMLLAAEAN